MKKAQEAELDLIVVGPGATPPVAKILDFKKFLYEERKKKSTSKAKSKKTEIKELRLSPTIGIGDIRRLAERTKEFIEDGNRVKVTVAMKGRQAMFPEVAMQKIKAFETEVAEFAKMDDEPKKMGNIIKATFSAK